MNMQFASTTALALSLAISGTVLAGNGNNAPPGPHYNLNIIGVDNPKTAKLVGGNGHRIFVDLGKNEQVTSKIYLVPGETFRVCDGNAFDTAYNCDGSELGDRTYKSRELTGAVFELPCNLNLPADDPLCTGDCTYTLVSCNTDVVTEIYGEDAIPTLSYQVWARALGGPGGEATITTCAEEDEDVDGNTTTEVICSTENVMLVRDPGRQVFEDVTKEMTSLVVEIDSDGDGAIDRKIRSALFSNNLFDWFWKYDNEGLRLAQLRFYVLAD